MNVEGVEEGEVAPAIIAATKVHVLGLAELTTQDIENFARDHYDSDLFKRVEWVDDNSANLVYDTAEAAKEALQIFSRESVEDPLESRAAKALATHPHVELFVRQAVASDQKERGAAHRSAFYLRHPELDPLENPRGRGRGRGWGGRSGRGRGWGRGGYREDDRHSRRGSNAEPFDVSLYDEDSSSLKKQAAQPLNTSRAGSFHSEEDVLAKRADRRPRRGEELFASKLSGRLRNRSASPIRDGDGRYGFSDDQPYRQTARRRSPIRARSHQENYAAREDLKTELFPSRKKSSALTNGNGAIELFPGRALSPIRRDDDLFPEKLNHKRHDAKDIHPNEVASAIGKFDISLPKECVSNNDSGRRPAPGRDLFSRIDANSATGRLNERPVSADDFSFKGASRKEDQGVSFLGASKDRMELFPKGRSSGGTRDLFEDKARSRRRGAEHFI